MNISSTHSNAPGGVTAVHDGLTSKQPPGRAFAHCIELRPTAEQLQYFEKCAGTSRFVYNRLVARSREDYESGIRYDRKKYQRIATDLRSEFPWMKEVSGRCTWEPADQFDHAIKRLFTGLGKKPSFKKKGERDRFRFSHSSQFKIVGRSLRVQGMKEPVLMRENIRPDGIVRSVSIKRMAGKWYATFLLLGTPVDVGTTRGSIVGVDLGIKTLAVLSDGDVFINPRALYNKQSLLARRQRQVSSKLKGSNRRERAKRRVAKIHKKIADIRSAGQHAVTNHLVRHYDTIVIEDLNVSGMVKNRKLSKAISDCGFGSIRSQLEYKAKWHGNTIIVADRFYASSKTCSACGEKKPILLLSERQFKCACGNTMDRDVNAAKNLEQYGRHQSEGDPKRTEEGRKTLRKLGRPVDAVNGLGLSGLSKSTRTPNTLLI